MPKTQTKKQQQPPMSIRITPDIRAKLNKIATTNGLSVTDVTSLSIAAGLNIVETQLAKIHTPETKAA